MPLISYVREDQFAAAVTSTAVPKLIKLHGSIIDMTSIRTTLSSIARRNLSDERVKIIDHLFEKKTRILILGYSCSDYFDIVDRIRNIKGSSAEIYFIDHQESGMSVEKVSAKAPLSNFNGYQVKINTDVFIEELWNAMGTG